MLDARLGYRNKGDAETDWKEYAKSFEARNLNCDIDEDKKIEGYHYNCSILPLFDLGSLHHDYYLLNIRCARTVYYCAVCVFVAIEKIYCQIGR